MSNNKSFFTIGSMDVGHNKYDSLDALQNDCIFFTPYFLTKWNKKCPEKCLWGSFSLDDFWKKLGKNKFFCNYEGSFDKSAKFQTKEEAINAANLIMKYMYATEGFVYDGSDGDWFFVMNLEFSESILMVNGKEIEKNKIVILSDFLVLDGVQRSQEDIEVENAKITEFKINSFKNNLNNALRNFAQESDEVQNALLEELQIMVEKIKKEN